MKRLKFMAALVVFGSVVCHAQSDPDCTPSAQRVIRDFQSDGTFSNDRTMQDVMAYAVAKCSASQIAAPPDYATYGIYAPQVAAIKAIQADIVQHIVTGPTTPVEPEDPQLKLQVFEKTCGVDAEEWNASCQKWHDEVTAAPKGQ